MDNPRAGVLGPEHADFRFRNGGQFRLLESSEGIIGGSRIFFRALAEARETQRDWRTPPRPSGLLRRQNEGGIGLCRGRRLSIPDASIPQPHTGP